LAVLPTDLGGLVSAISDKVMGYLAEHPGAGVPELSRHADCTYERTRLILRDARQRGEAERYRRTPAARVWSWKLTTRGEALWSSRS
jgi:DNA-binding MarR family transcriptional regulator